MEKLMKYVEEMQKEGINVCRPQVQQYDILYMILISKHYPLIKWLVENDKIDFLLIPNKIKEIGIPMKINGEIKYGFDSSDYYWLLMLLSISDTPIEDLISYLK